MQNLEKLFHSHQSDCNWEIIAATRLPVFGETKLGRQTSKFSNWKPLISVGLPVLSPPCVPGYQKKRKVY